MAEGGQPRLLDKKGKTSSLIWQHYGFKEADEAEDHIMCKMCYNVISAPLGNTTNLFNHLRRNPNVAYDELATKQKHKTTTQTTAGQTSITTTLYNATPYPSNSDKHTKITAAIGYFLAIDMHQ